MMPQEDSRRGHNKTLYVYNDTLEEVQSIVQKNPDLSVSKVYDRGLRVWLRAMKKKSKKPFEPQS